MKTRGWAAVAAVALLAGAVVTAACGDTTTVQGEDDTQRGITVTGEGKATAPPDVAVLTLGVTTLAETVAEARDRAASSLDAMITSMRDNGVAEKDVQTQHLSISPEYDYSNGRQLLRGYRVTNTLTAKLREIDRTSEIIDEAVTAGGDNAQVQGIGFTIDDPGELQTAAREEAVADARAKAETLAKASGVDLGDAISITEGGVVVPVPLSGAESRGAADVATPIEPGELDVTINVTVTWAIK